MNLESMKCPECGAPIKFVENRDYVFCSHCGTQVHKTDDNVKTIIHKNIDLARYKEATNREKELEIESTGKSFFQDFNLQTFTKLITLCVILLIVLLVIVLAVPADDRAGVAMFGFIVLLLIIMIPAIFLYTIWAMKNDKNIRKDK